MTYLLAIAAGAVGAVVGWLVTGSAAAWIAGLYGMSDFEGGRGMLAFLGVGPIGGLVAMVASVWLVLRSGKGRAPAGPMLARIGLVLAGIAALVAAGIGVRFLSIDTYSNEAPPSLEFELRLPAAMAVSDRSTLHLELDTDRNVGEVTLADPWSRTEGGAQIVAGSVALAFKTSSRLLVVGLPGQPTRLFELALSRNPSSTAELGAWQRPDHVDLGQERAAPAPKDDPVELRYRVRRAGED